MTTRASFALHLPIADVPNSNDRGHWSIASGKRRRMRAATKALVKQMGVTVQTPCALTLTFAFPDKRRRDLDNLECKGLIDGAVDGGILPDDDHQHLASVTRRLDTHKTARGMVRITAEFVTVGTEQG